MRNRMNSFAASSEFKASLSTFVTKLNQEKIMGSQAIAQETMFLMRKFIADDKWSNGNNLMERIREIGHYILTAQPAASPVRNMISRVLKIIREEHLTYSGKADEGDRESLQTMIRGEGKDDYLNTPINLKSEIIDAINEVIQELETTRDDIAGLALEHIHSNEVILTSGYSRTVETFLKKAASKKRKFSVIVAESAPLCQGHKLAANLADNEIVATLITDAAVFAMMSCVNKVIIGAHTVLANGGLKASIGSYTIALAAKQFSVPVIVCAARYKLSPQFHCSFNQAGFNKCLSPLDVLNWSEDKISSETDILNPIYDYVPPELVTLFLSDHGGYAPSYVYRLLSELYHPDDLVVEMDS